MGLSGVHYDYHPRLGQAREGALRHHGRKTSCSACPDQQLAAELLFHGQEGYSRHGQIPATVRQLGETPPSLGCGSRRGKLANGHGRCPAPVSLARPPLHAIHGGGFDQEL